MKERKNYHIPIYWDVVNSKETRDWIKYNSVNSDSLNFNIGICEQSDNNIICEQSDNSSVVKLLFTR